MICNHCGLEIEDGVDYVKQDIDGVKVCYHIECWNVLHPPEVI